MSTVLHDIFRKACEAESLLLTARSALEGEDYRGVVSMSIELLERDPTCVPALLLLALAAQLSSQADAEAVGLADVLEALRTAARYQELCNDAEHEYARFLFAVEGDSIRALDVLEKAMDRRSQQLRHLFLAQLEVLADLERGKEMKELLEEALTVFPGDADLLDFQKEHVCAGQGEIGPP